MFYYPEHYDAFCERMDWLEHNSLKRSFVLPERIRTEDSLDTFENKSFSKDRRLINQVLRKAEAMNDAELDIQAEM